MNDDAELLSRYADHGADEAFAELVRRHVNLVYSAALRQLNGDAHLAADATQLVFTDLARKAATLARHRVLAGWLFTSTRFVTAKLIRGERRRQAREQEAHLMQAISGDEGAAALDWNRIRPVLDEVLGELSADDREAVLLRFFEARDYRAIGSRLAISENTARMRVERALDKLRGRLARRGLTSTSAALALALTGQAVVAAPAGLAATVAGAALASGTVTAGGVAATGALASAIHFMSLSKLQVGLSGAFAVAGATGLVLQTDANDRLRDEVGALHQTTSGLEAVEGENRRLTRLARDVEEMRRDDAEFVRLQQEADRLRTRLQELAAAETARRAAQSANLQRFEIAQLDQKPLPRFQARPDYPVEMRQAGEPGQVVVDFVVDPEGNVQNAFALRSSRVEFESAAVEAVSKWKFRPGRKDGRDVNTHLQVPIVFTLAAGERRVSGTAGKADETKPADGPPFVVQYSSQPNSAAPAAGPMLAPK